MREIETCKACGLCANQGPLIQHRTNVADALVIGLSAVRVDNIQDEEPLGLNTKSGAFIRSILEPMAPGRVYYTNLVKCLPWRDGRIRYPTMHEVEACINNLRLELRHYEPGRIILLGRQVADGIARHFGVSFAAPHTAHGFAEGRLSSTPVLAVYHPSFVLKYRRSEVERYKSALQAFLHPAAPTYAE